MKNLFLVKSKNHFFMTKILVGSQENVSGSTSYLVPLQTIKLAGLLDLIKINIFSTLILVGSVIKFLDRNFHFIKKVQAFLELIINIT